MNSIVISQEYGGCIIIPREDGHTRYILALLVCNETLN